MWAQLKFGRFTAKPQNPRGCWRPGQDLNL
jgi:hypothetical protein